MTLVYSEYTTGRVSPLGKHSSQHVSYPELSVLTETAEEQWIYPVLCKTAHSVRMLLQHHHAIFWAHQPSGFFRAQRLEASV
jgi:hypothetical protein